MKIAQTIILTHFSLINFDGKSDVWKNHENFPFCMLHRSSISNSHYPEVFVGSLWHVSFRQNFRRSYKLPEVHVTSTFQLGKLAFIKYGRVEYVGRINFGFDQNVLALSILGIRGSKLSKNIFSNSIKLYTNVLTTPTFLNGHESLEEFREDNIERSFTEYDRNGYYPCPLVK